MGDIAHPDRRLGAKIRIYAWLLVGFVPVWVCGLIEKFTDPPLLPQYLFPLVAGVPVVVSFWIVVWQYEKIEGRSIATWARVLLILLSFLIELLGILGAVLRIG